jgi:hypothetical protein
MNLASAHDLTLVTVKWDLVDIDDSVTTLNLEGYFDHNFGQVIYLVDNAVMMSSYEYCAETELYDITNFNHIHLVKMRDPDEFGLDWVETLCERLHGISLHKFILSYFDRKADHPLALEQII